jgi:hypothetical protein
MLMTLSSAPNTSKAKFLLNLGEVRFSTMVRDEVIVTWPEQSPFKSKIRLEAENAALRHQLIVLRRKLRGRVKLANSDRWFFIQLYRTSYALCDAGEGGQ